MANQAKGQAMDCAFLASGKLCSTLKKQFYICVTYMEQVIIFYCQYRAASHAKQAVFLPKPSIQSVI